MESRFFERYGSLKKYDILSSIKTHNGTLVFEALKPFSGYYEGYPDLPAPLYIYLVTEFPFSQEQLLIALTKIKKQTSLKFSAAKAIVSLADSQFYSIRIRDIESYADIHPIQEMFEKEGLTMKRQTKKMENVEVFIVVKKFFQFESVNDTLMLDQTERDHGYFKIPCLLSWQTFHEISQQTKNNLVVADYDSALGLYFENYTVQPVIRIYNPKMNIEYLSQVQKEFFTGLERHSCL
ncbi:MAG TPA: hypothetical protein PK990_00485 [Salinivirgaceae bacterium]|nr:hypothetical protein [Salinivirgaceae bacterium]